LAEIDKAYQEGAYANEEEYQAARTAVIEKYTDLITTYSNLYGIATSEDARVVEDAWSTAYSNVVQDGGAWEDAITTYTKNVTTAFETWQSRISELTDLVGKDLDETKEKVNDITNASKLLKDELTKDVIPSVSKTLTEVRKLTGEYAIQRDSVLELAESYEELAKSIKETIREKAKLEKSE
jgi:DNA repair ATPase RecN